MSEMAAIGTFYIIFISDTEAGASLYSAGPKEEKKSYKTVIEKYDARVVKDFTTKHLRKLETKVGRQELLIESKKKK